MVLSGDELILAGPPDSADPAEALAAIEGRRGGILWAVNTEDGQKRTEYRLESSPRYDGTAIADNRCYVASHDGQLTCLGDAAGQ